MTAMPLTLNVEAVSGEEGPKVGTAKVSDDLPSVPTTTTPVGVSLKIELPAVTGGPFRNTVWVPTTTLVASGAAEMTVLPNVAMGIGTIVGLGINVLEPDFVEI